jgi:uncharacterized protein YndB with AHSA1/START domain
MRQMLGPPGARADIRRPASWQRTVETPARTRDGIIVTRRWLSRWPLEANKEYQVNNSAPGGTPILGSLRSADGKGIVLMEERFNTDIDDLWSALTDPERLSRWLADVEGDLRPGGEFRVRYLASQWEGTGRVESCQPPHRLRVLTKQAEAPDEQGGLIEARLTADGDQTVLQLEKRGLRLDLIAAFAAGTQVEVEDLAAYVAGHGRCDSDARMGELIAVYENSAVDIG